MFEYAIYAGLPLIRCTTIDTINLIDVIRHYTDKPLYSVKGLKVASLPAMAGGVAITNALDSPPQQVYQEAINSGVTVLLVNPEETNPLMFDVGELPVPSDLVKEHLSELVEEDAIPALCESLGGLTLREVSEISLLAMAMYDELTPESVLLTRKVVYKNASGLEQVDTNATFFIPNPVVSEWIATNGKFLHRSKDPRLVPRGLLLGGPPGVGKTESAKYIARELTVPLYRMDMSSLMVKWLGETESRLKRVLSQLDKEGPCVFLMDEVEKLFSQTDDNGVTQRLLAQLLWWLQEHESKVLTVMTTNNMKDLPPELYRSGRIDSTIVVRGLIEPKEKEYFIRSLVDSFDLPKNAKSEIAYEAIALAKDAGEVYHAALTHKVYDLIRKVI